MDHPDEPARPGTETRRLPLRSLKALAATSARECGPLSPLARIASPQEPADRRALHDALLAMQGEWAAFPATLLDPGLTLAVLVTDGERVLSGQFAWSNPAGLGPGFRCEVVGDQLEIEGPVTLEDVERSLLDALAPAGCVEPVTSRCAVDASEFWTLLALADAEATAAALQRATRGSGTVTGLSRADVESSWEAGLRHRNPGWAVSLVALLAPEAVPEDLVEKLPATLARLQGSGLVQHVPGGDDTVEDYMLPAGPLRLLSRSLSAGALAFGLVRNERTGPARIETRRLVGWRSPAGILLADLGALDRNHAELVITGPAVFVDVLTELLGTGALPAEMTAPEPVTPTPQQLLDGLSPDAAAGAADVRCGACNAKARPGARFCGQCGQPLG